MKSNLVLTYFKFIAVVLLAILIGKGLSAPAVLIVPSVIFTVFLLFNVMLSKSVLHQLPIQAVVGYVLSIWFLSLTNDSWEFFNLEDHLILYRIFILVVVEEFIFRHKLFKVLERTNYKASLKIHLVTFLFSVYHLVNLFYHDSSHVVAQILFSYVIGLALYYVSRFFNNDFCAIAPHLIFNLAFGFSHNFIN